MDGTPQQPADGALRQPVAYDPPSLQEPGPATAPATGAVVKTEAIAAPAVAEPVSEPQAAASVQPSSLPLSATASPDGAVTAPVQPAEPAAPAASVPDGGFYRPSADDGTDQASAAAGLADARRRAAATKPVEWTSSGDAFRAHAGNWRMRMGLIGVVGGALVFLVTRSFFSSGAIVFAGIAFALLGSRAPRPVDYRLDSRGISVGRKRFGYAEFRAFSVVEGTAMVNLVPLKRFAPVMVVRCDPALSAEIVQVLSDHLPMEAPRRDAVDTLVGKLKI